MQSFRQLRVWQKAHALTLELYRVTAKFPKDETYSLTSQIKRARGCVDWREHRRRMRSRKRRGLQSIFVNGDGFRQ